MQTNDRLITELMTAINNGRIQLPDFQRGWVWEDGRIKALIASIINNYPVGAAMFLEYGNENVRFKYRTIEGAEDAGDTVPTELILDGQQRLTSILHCIQSNLYTPALIKEKKFIAITILIYRKLWTNHATGLMLFFLFRKIK